MKKFFILFCSLLLGIASLAFTRIDEKLLQSFRSSFPYAEEVSWFESKETYIVSFKENGIRTRAVYTIDGRIRNLTRAYQEEHLPYPIKFRIKQEYPNKNIFGVLEIITSDGNSGKTEYNIKLEDGKHWYTVQVVSDSEMSVIEKFRKAL